MQRATPIAAAAAQDDCCCRNSWGQTNDYTIHDNGEATSSRKVRLNETAAAKRPKAAAPSSSHAWKRTASATPHMRQPHAAARRREQIVRGLRGRERVAIITGYLRLHVQVRGAIGIEARCAAAGCRYAEVRTAPQRIREVTWTYEHASWADAWVAGQQSGAGGVQV